MPTCFGLIFCILVSSIHLVNSEDFDNFTKPNPLPKYFAIDIDNTFHVEDETVFKRNIAAFKSLKGKNVTAFFCTGRDPQSNRKLLGDSFFTETGYTGFPGIYTNGSLVYDPQGNVLKIEKLSEDFLNKFNDFITTNNLKANVVFYTENGLFKLDELCDIAKRFLESKHMEEPKTIGFDDLKQKNVLLITFFSFNIEDDLKNEVCYVGYPDYDTAQITPKGCNKKSGLEVLLTNLQSKSDECAFIGDSENDEQAMEYCTPSFAVGNSTDSAKQKAKWVLKKKHDEGAFEEVVKKLFDYNPGSQ